MTEAAAGVIVLHQGLDQLARRHSPMARRITSDVTLEGTQPRCSGTGAYLRHLGAVQVNSA
ncbi:MAG TPA: hypothetical protein VEH31_03710 [Streptosporangiaceae bacterium]|nr:hypothetical protein [Streptosporangiaceae bacterium]